MIENGKGNVQAIVEMKDRTLVKRQNELIENPTLMDWTVVIEQNKGKKEFNIKNNLDSSIAKEEKAYEETIAPKASTKVETPVEESLKTVEEYHVAIKELTAKVPVVIRPTVKTELTKLDLPFKATEIAECQDVEKLSKIYNVLTKMVDTQEEELPF
jgi:hypothetical protein